LGIGVALLESGSVGKEASDPGREIGGSIRREKRIPPEGLSLKYL
jgi:hypothetical protein